MAEYIFLKHNKTHGWIIFAVDLISTDEAASILLRRLRRRKYGFVGCFDIRGILCRITAIKSGKVNFPVRGYIKLGGVHEGLQLQEILQKRGEAVVCENPKNTCKRKARGSHGKLFCCIRSCERF